MALGLSASAGSSSLGTWLSLKSVPPLDSGGGRVLEEGGGEPRRREELSRGLPRPVTWVRGSHPVLSSGLAPWEEG